MCAFCCDDLWKSVIMAPEKPGKLWEFFYPTLWPPWRIEKVLVCRESMHRSGTSRDRKLRWQLANQVLPGKLPLGQVSLRTFMDK